jgi:hypothetical protein
MDNKSEIEMIQLANSFWEAFMEKETEIKELIFKRTQEDHQTARDITDSITDTLGFKGCVGILFGVDVRNGLMLTERKDYIELIITPLYQRINKRLVLALYNAHANYLPKYWSVIKYKFHQSSNIDSITVNYRDEDNPANVIEITKDDFSYFPILNAKENKLSIVLFINDEKAKYLIKKEKYEINGETRDLWIPKDYGIYAVLDSAIGEYHLLNTLDKMEIYKESEEKEITERHPIKKIADVVVMIANNPMSNIHKCSRCNYPNTQTKLGICKCKKAYYCDSICQKAHRKLHKLNCL